MIMPIYPRNLTINDLAWLSLDLLQTTSACDTSSERLCDLVIHQILTSYLFLSSNPDVISGFVRQILTSWHLIPWFVSPCDVTLSRESWAREFTHKTCLWESRDLAVETCHLIYDVTLGNARDRIAMTYCLLWRIVIVTHCHYGTVATDFAGKLDMPLTS